MKVSRKSWHYKLSHFLDEGTNEWGDNLCKYFWRLVGKVIVAIVLTIAITVILITYFTSPMVIPVTIVLISSILAVLLPVFVISKLRKKYGKPVGVIPENIFFEYVKAKKLKVCPLIEYVD